METEKIQSSSCIKSSIDHQQITVITLRDIQPQKLSRDYLMEGNTEYASAFFLELFSLIKAIMPLQFTGHWCWWGLEPHRTLLIMFLESSLLYLSYQMYGIPNVSSKMYGNTILDSKRKHSGKIMIPVPLKGDLTISWSKIRSGWKGKIIDLQNTLGKWIKLWLHLSRTREIAMINSLNMKI